MQSTEMTPKLTAVGITLDYCPNAMFPQTPHIEDVLYALQRHRQPKYFGDPNFYGYTVDVLLVTAVVASDILYNCWSERDSDGSRCIDEDKARAIIAQAIHDLSTQEARCLFNSAYAECAKVMGLPMPDDDASASDLRAACGCPECRKH